MDKFVDIYNQHDHLIWIDATASGCESIYDNLHDDSNEDGAEAFNNMLDGLTSFILHCYCNDVDVSGEDFKKSITDSLETFANYC